LIENYEEAINDKNTTWDLHHIRELTPDGDFAYSAKDLIRMNLYYQRPANELIFLRKSEHRSLHKKGKKLSDETRAKMSEAKKGKKLSEEHRAKIGAAKKNMSAETRAKISEAKKGHNNPFYGKKLSAETRAKMTEAHKGKKLSAETKQKLSESTTKYWQNRRKKKRCTVIAHLSLISK
jgi:hypothetical protein